MLRFTINYSRICYNPGSTILHQQLFYRSNKTICFSISIKHWWLANRDIKSSTCCNLFAGIVLYWFEKAYGQIYYSFIRTVEQKQTNSLEKVCYIILKYIKKILTKKKFKFKFYVFRRILNFLNFPSLKNLWNKNAKKI